MWIDRGGKVGDVMTYDIRNMGVSTEDEGD